MRVSKRICTGQRERRLAPCSATGRAREAPQAKVWTSSGHKDGEQDLLGFHGIVSLLELASLDEEARVCEDQLLSRTRQVG